MEARGTAQEDGNDNVTILYRIQTKHKGAKHTRLITTAISIL
jgi:hypothetical protein